MADELCIHVNTIYKWSEQYRADPEHTFPGSGHMKPDEEELARAKRHVRSEPAFPNLLNQRFDETEKNRVWLSDITYVHVNGAWNYLAALMDLGRRKVVGWALGTNPAAELACRALRNALIKEHTPEGLIHHSDRGCQYTSKAYRRLLEQNKITGSMSRKRSPYDNAPMESFFQTLKTEYIYKQSFQMIEQSTASLKHWIDVYYNCRRLHSALGYKSPLFYELSRYQPFSLSACPVTTQRGKADYLPFLPHWYRRISASPHTHAGPSDSVTYR